MTDEPTAEVPAKTQAFILASQDLKLLISKLDAIKKDLEGQDKAHIEEALSHIVEAQLSLYRAGP